LSCTGNRRKTTGEYKKPFSKKSDRLSASVGYQAHPECQELNGEIWAPFKQKAISKVEAEKFIPIEFRSFGF
jgi:hypothetical protein